MILQLTPFLIAIMGLLMWLLPKPSLPPPRVATLGIVIFAVGLLFAVANVTASKLILH